MARQISNQEFYSRALKVHGNSVKALHWNSTASQQLRFKMIKKLLPSNISELQVVDAGCGFAHLYDYLEGEKLLPKEYIGLDVMPEMVAQSKERTGCKIFECDIINDTLIEADYYICSGAMNILTPFEMHLFIKKCFDASREGFIFNVLQGKDESLVYNYVLPSTIRKIAQQLNCNVQLIDGYMENDISVKLSRKKNSDKSAR